MELKHSTFACGNDLSLKSLPVFPVKVKDAWVRHDVSNERLVTSSQINILASGHCPNILAMFHLARHLRPGISVKEKRLSLVGDHVL